MTDMRLAKFLSASGLASRRAAEHLIAQGRVTVNGAPVTTPVFFVTAADDIRVDNQPVRAPERIRIWMFHKPTHTMTTARDPDHRQTIYDVLGAEYKNLKYIGRLDYMTSGLLLLTNNGDVARQLTLPSFQIERTYIATVKNAGDANLDAARRGITLDGIQYRPMRIDQVDNHTLRVTVTEGKKNEVRNVLRAIGAPVQKLHRISFGPIKLGNLKPGEILELSQKSIDAVMKSLYNDNQ